MLPVVGAFAAIGIAKASTLGKYGPVDSSYFSLGIIPHIFGLFLLGLFMHITGMTLDEYVDADLDKSSPRLKTKPLVKGTITSRGALKIAVGFWVATWVLGLWLGRFDPICTLLLGISILFGTASDIFGGRGARAPAANFLLGGWAATTVLYGAASTLPSGSSILLDPFILCLAALVMLQIFLFFVLGDMKDLDTDMRAGARTIAVVFGLKTNGRLSITSRFRFFVWVIKIMHIIVVILAFWIMYGSALGKSRELASVVAALLIFTDVVSVKMTARLLSVESWETGGSREMFSTYGLHEMATYASAPILLIPLTGLLISIVLVVFPVSWYIICNKVLYGTWLKPNV